LPCAAATSRAAGDHLTARQWPVALRPVCGTQGGEACAMKSDAPQPRWFVLLRLMRPKQWAKNAFVFAPLFFSGRYPALAEVTRVAVAALAFCMIASAIYVFNDWCDQDADRRHPRKRSRPLAAHAVSSAAALTFAAVLIVAALGLAFAFALPWAFLAVVAVYLVINAGYSLGLKRVAVLEMFLVASGFVLRLVAGAEVLAIAMSPWIVVATGMVAMLLTAGKRRGDIAQSGESESLGAPLRGYNLAYLDSVVSALVGATLVVYLLFCISDYAHARYGPSVIVTAVPVAMGLLRFQQIVMVENGGDSPTDLVLGDGFLLTVIAVFVLLFAALIYA
jgi:4-hydroxybenzoate polyprenyltransferase